MEPFVCDVVGIERLGGSELAGEGSPSAHRAHPRARGGAILLRAGPFGLIWSCAQPNLVKLSPAAQMAARG